MQVLLTPLTRQPLTEEEFYELGEQTLHARFVARLRRLVLWSNRRDVVVAKRPEVVKANQITALAGCDSQICHTSPKHRREGASGLRSRLESWVAS